MELEELRHHWKTYRSTATGEETLSEDELSDLIPPETIAPYWQKLTTATRYAAVYGFLIFCCNGC